MSIPMSETDSLGSEVVDRKSSLYLKISAITLFVGFLVYQLIFVRLLAFQQRSCSLLNE